MEVVTCAGRAAFLDFRRDGDAVRVWWQGRCVSVFSRDQVAAWLTARTRVSSGALTLRTDPERRPALLLTDVGLWTVAPQALITLAGLVGVRASDPAICRSAGVPMGAS